VKDLREVFDLMDKDSGGTLSIEEIKQLMEMLGMKMPPDELEDLVATIDLDGSGQIDFEVRHVRLDLSSSCSSPLNLLSRSF
jgi:calmodulin